MKVECSGLDLCRSALPCTYFCQFSQPPSSCALTVSKVLLRHRVRNRCCCVCGERKWWERGCVHRVWYGAGRAACARAGMVGVHWTRKIFWGCVRSCFHCSSSASSSSKSHAGCAGSLLFFFFFFLPGGAILFLQKRSSSCGPASEVVNEPLPTSRRVLVVSALGNEPNCPHLQRRRPGKTAGRGQSKSPDMQRGITFRCIYTRRTCMRCFCLFNLKQSTFTKICDAEVLSASRYWF